MSPKVLVPIDFSDLSTAALVEAQKLVASTADIHLAHVLAPLSPVAPAVIWETIDENARQASVIEALQKVAAEQSVKDAQLHVRTGDAGRQIAHLAKELDVDLIVIPTHGRTGFSRLLLGSVTERVIRLAPCSVLVVRTPRTEEARKG